MEKELNYMNQECSDIQKEKSNPKEHFFWTWVRKSSSELTQKLSNKKATSQISSHYLHDLTLPFFPVAFLSYYLCQIWPVFLTVFLTSYISDAFCSSLLVLISILVSWLQQTP